MYLYVTHDIFTPVSSENHRKGIHQKRAIARYQLECCHGYCLLSSTSFRALDPHVYSVGGIPGKSSDVTEMGKPTVTMKRV